MRLFPIVICAAFGCEGRNTPAAQSPTFPDLGRTSVDPPPMGVLALTFDDGPSAQTTPDILATLEKHGARATFFVLGRNIAGNRDLLASEQRRGHAIGNHSFYHEPQPTLAQDVFAQRTLAVKTNIGDHDGGKLYYRFPYGAAGPEQMNWIAGLDVKGRHYKVVGWNIDSQDWEFGAGYPSQPTSSSILDDAGDCGGAPNPFQHDFVGWTQFIVRKVGGGVILFHDIQPITRDHLDEILTGFESPSAYWSSLPSDKQALYKAYYACFQTSTTTSFTYAALDSGPWPSLRNP